VTPPLLGTSWRTQVDIATPGASASLVGVVATGPATLATPLGEVLIDVLGGPLLGGVSVGSGTHALAIPDDCNLVGLKLYSQAATYGPGGVRLQNAIDVVLGTY